MAGQWRAGGDSGDFVAATGIVLHGFGMRRKIKEMKINKNLSTSSSFLVDTLGV
jgi:hypothetical protein